MKKILAILFMFLPLMAAAGTRQASPAEDGGVPKAGLMSEISAIKACEGADVIKLGGLGTSAIKALILGSIPSGDPDAEAFRSIFRGVKKVVIADWDGCSSANRAYFCKKIDKLLAHSEPIMEVKDEGETLRIFGVLDDVNGQIRDFVMYAPADCALICLFGKFDLDAISRVMQN